MKNIAFVVKVMTVVTAMTFTVNVSADDNDQLILGNSVNKTTSYKSVGSSRKTAGFASYYPEERMQAYAGCTISEMRVAVTGTNGESPMRVFVTHDLNGEPLCEQTVIPQKDGWVNVAFDTPYQIDGTGVYIGYEIDGVIYLCYGTRLLNGEEWLKRGGEEWKSTTEGASASFYAVVSGQNVPGNDIVLGHVVMPDYGTVGKKMTYTGEFVNVGSKAVENIDVVVHADGEEQTFTVDGLNVSPRGRGYFNVDDFVLDKAGEPDTWLEIRNVNGAPDAAPYDNITRHKHLLCLTDYVKRNVLLEVFSTERCPNCPPYHETIGKTLGNKENLIEIGHHAGYYTDQYTIDASKDYEWFYITNHLYAPAIMFDRTNMTDNYPTVYDYRTPVAAPQGNTLSAYFEEAAKVPAFATVDIQSELDKDTRHLNVTVSGEMLLRDMAEEPHLYVFLTEDNVPTTTQSGASGTFYHRYLARKCLTASSWGDAIDLKNGYSKDYSVDIPEDWEMRNMSIVAFVGNYDENDHNNCKVLNAAEMRLSGLLPDAIEDISINANAKVTDVYTLSGTRVASYNGNTIEEVTKSLPQGIYIVDVVSGDNHKKVKLPVRL